MFFRLLFIIVLLSPSTANVKPRSHAISEIDRLVKSLDSVSIDEATAQLFGDTSGPYTPKEVWLRFVSIDDRDSMDCVDVANVWRRSNGARVVEMNSSYSGDWSLYVNSYYRSDGSLAKLESILNSFNGSVAIQKTKYFDAAGNVLQSKTIYMDLESGHRLSPQQLRKREFMDRPLVRHPKPETMEMPYYPHLRDWPFYRLLL